jgi:ATP-dependent RNA helicase SUPV3L1/SUV3
VSADGEVSVGPEPIGHLSGFEFRVDPAARLADKRLLLAAAERRLGDELERRASSLIDAPDSDFALLVEDSGAVGIGWNGNVLARLAPGRSLLEPAVRTARPLDRLSANSRSALRARLERWVDAQVDGHLRPLKRVAEVATDATTSPGVRAVGAMLADAGGAVPRRAIVSAIGTLEQDDRQLLYRLKVRLGPLDVYVPALLKPAAQLWRAALLAVRSGEPMPEIPAAGMATLAADADPRGAALAYRRAGRTWVRVDLADRLASHAHKVRSAGGDNPVDSELATSLGLGEESLVRLMADVGFARTGDSWRWRGRRGSRPAPRETGSNAFAELEKLRRK